MCKVATATEPVTLHEVVASYRRERIAHLDLIDTLERRAEGWLRQIEDLQRQNIELLARLKNPIRPAGDLMTELSRIAANTPGRLPILVTDNDGVDRAYEAEGGPHVDG